MWRDNETHTRRSAVSCAHCLAWGIPFARGICLACYNFTRTRNAKPWGTCGACNRDAHLRSGYCRLCWQQAYLERPTGPNTPLAPFLRRVRHHQLFFADLNHRVAAPKRIARRQGVKGRPLKPPPLPAGRPDSAWMQPPLFTDLQRTYLRATRPDLRRGPVPDNPWLAWALYLAHRRAEAHGWTAEVRRDMQRALVQLLADHQAGQLIPASQARAVALRHSIHAGRTLEILATMGVVEDDLPSAFDRWLKARLNNLAPAIATDVERWARSLRDGTPRSLPRSPETVRSYVRLLHPALLQWSTRYHHLREVTRDDVLDHVGRHHGHARHDALSALRSLFTWAKRNKVVFHNPTARIHLGKRERPPFQPLTPEKIRSTVAAATTLPAKLYIVLAAVHAARPGHIRTLRPRDVDLAARRITIDGKHRPLDDLTRTLLEQWLAYRRDHWPDTANPHLLVSRDSALGTEPVSAIWISYQLRGHGATIEQLRIDRQLEEALVHDADPLHLAAVFEIDASTAIRYTDSARQLLTRPIETRPAGLPTNPRSDTRK
jgi:site-specific recombinase XerC